MTDATEDGMREKFSKKRQKYQEEAQKRTKQYSAAIQRASSTADGKILIHYLMMECGYQKNSVQGSKTTGQFLDENTMYNEGRRDLYLNLRKILKRDILADVEIYGVLGHLKEVENFEDMFK